MYDGKNSPLLLLYVLNFYFFLGKLLFYDEELQGITNSCDQNKIHTHKNHNLNFINSDTPCNVKYEYR